MACHIPSQGGGKPYGVNAQRFSQLTAHYGVLRPVGGQLASVKLTIGCLCLSRIDRCIPRGHKRDPTVDSPALSVWTNRMNLGWHPISAAMLEEQTSPDTGSLSNFRISIKLPCSKYGGKVLI